MIELGNITWRDVTMVDAGWQWVIRGGSIVVQYLKKRGGVYVSRGVKECIGVELGNDMKIVCQMENDGL